MKLLKHYFSRSSEDVTPLERLAVKKANSLNHRYSHIINALLILEVVTFFSVIVAP